MCFFCSSKRQNLRSACCDIHTTCKKWCMWHFLHVSECLAYLFVTTNTRFNTITMRSVAAPLLKATSSSSSRRPLLRGRRKTAVASVASTNETETKEEETKRIAIVFGATGGVGQLVCAKLLLDDSSRRYDVVHAMCRNRETGEAKLKTKNASSA